MKRNWPKMVLMLLGIHFLTGCNTPTQYEPMDATAVEEPPSSLLLQTPVQSRQIRVMSSHHQSLPRSSPPLRTPGQSRKVRVIPSNSQSSPTSLPPLQQTPGQ